MATKKKTFFVSSESSDEEEFDDDVTLPKQHRSVTRAFNPNQGSFIRLKKRNAAVTTTDVSTLSETLGLGKQPKIGATPLTPAPKKLAKVKKSGFASSVMLHSIDEKEERNLGVQGKAGPSKKLKSKDKEWKKLQEAKPEDSPPNTPQIFTPSPVKASNSKFANSTPNTTGNRSTPRSAKKLDSEEGTPVMRSPSKFFKKSPSNNNGLSKKALHMTPVNTRPSFSPRMSQEKRPEKRKSSSMNESFSGTDHDSTSSSWTPAKRAKLDSKRGDTPKLKKNAKSNKSKEFNQRNNSRLSNNSLKSNVSGRLSNEGSKLSSKTPEFMKVKEDDSARQKKQRRRFRNKVMSLKTAKGQPVMRGRINLMLDKIKADLSTP